MMNGLAVGVVALPLLTAGAVLALRHRPRSARTVALGGALLEALASLGLLPLVGQGTLLTFTWVPPAEPMGLYAGAMGVYLAVLTAWSALLCLFYATPDEEVSPVAMALGLFAAGSATAAFLLDHFLARYAALEMTALCAALLLVAEQPAPEGPHLAWRSYLVLRLGGAGLLASILLLLRHNGTFTIGAALEGGAVLPPAALFPIVAGFLLTVWVEMGSIPFHVWLTQGTHLSWPVLALVYATIIPNLGGYLLYRVAPLLMRAGPLRQGVLWLGAAVALLAMGLALMRQDLKHSLIYVVVAQGGLALSLTGNGAPEAMLMGLLGQIPIRLLLFLGAGAARAMPHGRRLLLVLSFGLSGLTLAGLTLVTVWWTRQAGGSPALVVAEAVVALTAIWAVRTSQQFYHLYNDDLSPPATTVAWPRLAAIALLTLTLLAGWLAFGPLVHFLAPTMRIAIRRAPTLPQLLRYLFIQPVPIGTLLLALICELLVRRLPFPSWLEGLDDLECALSQWTARITLEGALFGLASGLHRTIELAGLERFNRLAARSAQRVGEALRRLHTGRLRRNLLWGAISLALALIILLLLYPL